MVRLRTLSLVAVASLAALAVSFAVANPQPGICADNTDTLCSIEPPVLTKQAALTDFGWTLIGKLAGHGDSTDPDFVAPDWEHDATKCDVHLVFSTCVRASKRKADPQPGIEADHLVASLNQAVQSGQLNPATTSRKSVQPQVASVLYNRIAADALQQRLASFPTSGAVQQLPAGSMIVKPIWALVSRDQDQTLFVTKTTPASERIWKAANTHFPYPVAEDKRFFEPIALSTARADRKPCDISPTGLPSVITGQCVHLYRHIVRPTSNEESSDFMFRCQPSCTTVLVGLQLMVRTETAKDWVWIGMWYTGRDNGRLPAPWKYYTIDVTNTPRGALVAGKPNIVFNPYLEGVTANGNGAMANCQNCHSYAAHDTSAHTMMLQGLDAQHGDRIITRATIGPKDFPPFDPQHPGDYLDHAVQTDFIWSLAGKELPPQ